MTDWFRSWHGAPTDPKWLGIARKAGVAPGMVVAVAWALMDRASQAEDRGDIDGYDPDGLACFFGCDPEQIDAIVRGMADRGVIVNGRFAAALRLFPTDTLRPSSAVWSALRATVFERDDFTCVYCGAQGVRLECDHVIPVSRGGLNDLSNLATACKNCNRAKRNKLVEEWSR